MSHFKIKLKKSTKNNNNDNHFTLDVKHEEIVQNFQKMQQQLPAFKNKLKNLIDERKKLEKLLYNDEPELFLKSQQQLFNVTQEITNLEKKINDIENHTAENKYYLTTSNILFDYYKADQQHPIQFSINTTNEQNDTNKTTEVKLPNTSKPGILNFFQKVEPKELKVEKDEEQTPIRSNKISDYIDSKNKFNKSQLLEEYLSLIDDNYLNKDNLIANPDVCPSCEREMMLIKSEGILVCNDCGIIQRTLIDSDKPCYKEPPPENNYFAYKRINHLNECLSQFQARETTEIPDEVYEKLLIEIKKERIVNMAEITQSKLKEYLKKLDLNKYYEHIPHILYKLTGISPPVIPKEIEETLRNMFKEIQGPFLKICPKDRKNFLSYSYVLYKLIELLNINDLKKYFPLLKSREKLYQQDLMWKQICEELGWKFIKSI